MLRGKRMMLALDQALRTTGWAVFKDDELCEYGTFYVPTNMNMGKRLEKFMEEVGDLVDKYRVDIVCFEDIQDQANISTFKILAFVQAAGMIFCAGRDIKFDILAPSHWRKILGGGFGRKREEQKRKSVELVKEKYGYQVCEDAADAICIGLAWLEENKNK